MTSDEEYEEDNQRNSIDNMERCAQREIDAAEKEISRLHEKIRVLQGQLKSEQERVDVLSAALESERQGKVVLFEFDGKGPQVVDGIFQGGTFSQQLHGKRGVLVFRPTDGK